MCRYIVSFDDDNRQEAFKDDNSISQTTFGC